MPSVFSRRVFRTELDSATAAGRATAVRHPSAARGGPYLAGGQTLISTAQVAHVPRGGSPRARVALYALVLRFLALCGTFLFQKI